MRRDTGQTDGLLAAAICHMSSRCHHKRKETYGKKRELSLEKRGRAGAPVATVVEIREMSAAGVARAVAYSSSRCR